jgi:hypothetical protein
MVRKFAQLHVSSSDDPDVEALTIEAQWLYFKALLAHPTLSSCGVMDWRPKKLVRKGKNVTVYKILTAAAELEATRFLLVDLETEEVLLRSLVRRDELLKNPKMAGAVIKAFHAVASRELQAALVTEVKRIRAEFPEYSSWSHKDTEADLTRILSRPDLSSVGYTNAFADQIDYGNTDVRAVDITNPDPVENGYDGPDEIGYEDPAANGYESPVPDTDAVPEPDNPDVSVPIPSTCTSTYNQAPLGGPATGVRHQGAGLESEDPPPRSCPEHPNGTTEACAACGIYRRAAQALAAEAKRAATEARAAEREAEADVRRQAIANCPLDCAANDGYIGTTLCSHDPDLADRARRGMAQVRAAMVKTSGAPPQFGTNRPVLIGPPSPEELELIDAELARSAADADMPPPEAGSGASGPTGRSESASSDESRTIEGFVAKTTRRRRAADDRS